MSESYDEKKENIKKTALQVFARYGYYKTTMDDIAEGVGIKKNSLYYYFSNKESLFEEILREESEKMFNSVKEAVSKVESVDEKIRMFFREFHCYGRKKKQNYSISIDKMIEFGQVVDEYFNDYYNVVLQMLKEILDEGSQSGELKKIDTEKTASILLKFISSYQREEIRKNKNKSFDTFDFEKIENEVKELLNMIINGIK
jgi:AcrR family transcriptional regulator